jgi:hypothetical protein
MKEKLGKIIDIALKYHLNLFRPLNQISKISRIFSSILISAKRLFITKTFNF